MQIKASEKLFYGKFGFKILLRQTAQQENFQEVCNKIRLYLLANAIVFHQRIETKKQGLTLCLNCEETIKWMRVEFPDNLVRLTKPVNEAHKEELLSSNRIRIRPLFFRKFKYSLTFSRFKARLHHINLGDQTLLNGAIGFEHGEGELLGILSQYERSQWHVVNKYDLTIYCNNPHLVMRLRLKYEAIITDFKSVRTIEEFMD